MLCCYGLVPEIDFKTLIYIIDDADTLFMLLDDTDDTSDANLSCTEIKNEINFEQQSSSRLKLVANFKVAPPSAPSSNI